MKVTKQDVEEVFRRVFDRADLRILPEMRAQDVEGWDSINNMNLTLALEEKFKVRFTTDELVSMTCVGDLFAILNRHDVEVSW